MESRPHSPPEIPATSEDVRRYLGSVLPSSQLATERVHSEYDPLILLYTTSIVAAFAFPNGDTKRSYDNLYGGFKKFYTRSGASDALDVAFVFCAHPDAPNLDLLCSRVETDVYFCRKFVVRLVSPLNWSLARLPFLPLTPLGSQTLRPPSAQTYLQRCGVPSTLAKYLVVQRERGAARIVDDCVSGVFGKPQELTPSATDPVTPVERTANPIRFESIRIQDFRAYRRPQTFRLGADITVLYGPNGFGKTSLFDAIDFAVTGDIGRMNSSNDSHFRKIARHLDSGPDDGIVTLSFRSNGAVRMLERRVSGRKQGTLDGRSVDRKTILRELTSGEFPSADRIENFVSLFRATHLFSQEHQELMSEFHNDCELSDRIVSRLLAFEDYESAANKTARVREILQSAIDRANSQISDLSVQIVDESKEIDRLSRSVERPRNVDELRDSIEAFRIAISDAGISLATDGSDVEAIRGWRAAIEMRHATARTQIDRLSALAKDAAARPRLHAELDRIVGELERAEAAVDADRKRHIASAEELQLAKIRQAKNAASRMTIQERSRILAWVQATVPKYTELVGRVHTLNEELEHTNSTLSSHRQSEADAAKELQTLHTRVKETEHLQQESQARLNGIQELHDTAAKWKTSKNQLFQISQEQNDLHESLAVLTAEEGELQSKHEEVLATEARLVRHLADIDRGQSELRQLLLQLKGRVRDGTCPLCGESHGSLDVLMQRIEMQIVTDAASEDHVELQRVRTTSESLKDQLDACTSRRSAMNSNLTRIAEDRIELESGTEKFEELAREHDVSIDESIEGNLLELCATLSQEIEKRNQEVEKLNEEVRTTRGNLEHIQDQVAKASLAKKEVTTELETTQEELTQLREDPRLVHVPLDVGPDRLAQLVRRNSEEETVVSAQLQTADNAVVQISAGLISIREEEDSRQAELDALHGRVTQSRMVLAELDARLEGAEFPPDVEEDVVLSKVTLESHAQAEFLSLRDHALGLELAIDRATTAAALSQLRRNLEEKQRRVSVAKREIIQHAPWLEYFRVLSGLISGQRNEATDDFTREYGPRTSVIQRRLRSVYGFDDVEIQGHESKIRVRVKRRNEELRPTDYFSQSQQQTLLLGLFLTTCLSQTWSSLSPVLLDDPVTHFDDLNTYAFLDLVSGLIELESEGRQFIVSTCDEKFLQVARQKFRHLGDRAAFYTFSAIDDKGPLIDLLSSHGPIANA